MCVISYEGKKSKSYNISILLLWMLPFLFIACKSKEVPNQDMIELIKAAYKYDNNPDNVFSPEAIVKH